MWGLKDLPAPVVTTLEGHLGEILRESVMVQHFTALGLEPFYAPGDAFRRFITADLTRNSELPRSANFQPE